MEKKKEKERSRVRKKEKIEKKREKDVQGQLLSICIQFSKRKTKYIGINLKKWPLLRNADLYIIDHRHYIRAPVGANKIPLHIQTDKNTGCPLRVFLLLSFCRTTKVAVNV